MLKLTGITKNYVTGDTTVGALKGINLEFRKSEFVAVLGHSGCGKTTLLNIIGGLDKYTSGDLVINGKSTKDFSDADWDTYRNHSIGFVFQSYNLIPHQTVLSNVELALTLSGVSKEERRKRATEALERVGLGDQLHKKPNQMSGGQMQRVAIARALVNDPDILLADEPTGALDSETSVQIMEILKEISKDKLIIMVTHNPELADTYANRIIRLKDGQIEGDTNPYKAEENVIKVDTKKKKSMSFLTAFFLSLTNLMTKKGRTLLTAFAGSIGIIGIALILAVSQGTTAYINHVQESTLSSYPLTLESTTVDMSSLLESFLSAGNDSDSLDKDRVEDAVYKDQVIGELVEALSKIETNENDLASFKVYIEKELENEESDLSQALSAVQYVYDIDLTIYTKNADGEIIKSDTKELMAEMIADFMMKSASNNSGENNEQGSNSGSTSQSQAMSSMMGTRLWQQMLPGLRGETINETLKNQYDLVYGSWPNEHDEIVLVLNKNNELDDLTLYALGLLSKNDIDAIIDAAVSGGTLPKDNSYWTYEQLCNLTFKAILPANCYKPLDQNGTIYGDFSKSDVFLEELYNEALELKISGIIRLNEDVDQGMLSSGIGYTSKLTSYIIKEAISSDVVIAQMANPDFDILTGLPFKSTSETMTDAEKAEAFKAYVAKMSVKEKAQVYLEIKCLEEQLKSLDTNVEFTLSQMNDKDLLISQISETIATEMGADPAQIATYLQNMTLDELKEMLRPSIREMVKAQINAGVAMGLSAMTDDQKATALDAEISAYTTEKCALYYDEITVFSSSTYDENLVKLGKVDEGSPKSINLFSSTFEAKDNIKAIIDSYNDDMESNGQKEKQIAYTDYVGLMMSSVTQIINAITYVLVAFVATSLVVSSIMIGVITLISVQERTKEIGILRAIGASKKDISRVFNAETLIVGFAAGLVGILITLILIVFINIILYALTGLSALKATLGFGPAIILIVISMSLTLIAGLIPSRIAAKKDPVVALRTE